jgi:cell division protein FtsQ
MNMVGRKRKVRRNTYKAGIRQRRQNRRARIRKTVLTVVGLVLFAVFNLGLILAHDWITQTHLLPIETVQVEGAHRLSAAAVRQRAGISAEDNILAVNLGAARRRLQAHPWIADARVIREIPSRIVIRIREHDCRAILNLDRQFLISAAGVVFKERQANECAEVPVISGIGYTDLGLEDQPCGASLAAALALLEPGTEPAPLGDHMKIREIRADPDLGLTLFLTAPGTDPTYRTIILGFADWQHKSQKLSAVQSYLGRRGLMPDAQIFNLRDPDRVVISPGARTTAAEPAKEV